LSGSDLGIVRGETRLMNNEPVHREWTIASDIREIEPLVADAVGVCAAADISPRACRLNIPVALTEALSNAILRGNNNERERHVFVTLSLNEISLKLEVTDEGSGFDELSAHFSPDDTDWLEREDGRGLFLMRSLMDSVELAQSSGNQGHTVRLVLKRK
jgi:serine/threonine-protein kinase RsbW